MILQKGNSGGLKCWGCSAFEVLAPVAIERTARMRRALRPYSLQASAKSAILHSCIMAQQTGWSDDSSGQQREILWDEENRIKAIADNGQIHSYGYDAVYVNPYVVVRSNMVTKHYYFGS